MSGRRMDAKRMALEGKLEDLLMQASAVAAELQAVDQRDQTPHFDQVEMPAHEVGQRLSRMIQTTRSREIGADNLDESGCPECGRMCRVDPQTREVHHNASCER